jgi:hypothetical protein
LNNPASIIGFGYAYFTYAIIFIIIGIYVLYLFIKTSHLAMKTMKIYIAKNEKKDDEVR